MNEREALLCLNAVSGLGSVRIQRLLETFGCAVKIWQQSKKILCSVDGIGGKIAESVIEFDCDDFLKKENALLCEKKINIVTFCDTHYPEYLKEIPGAPLVIYYAGDLTKITFPGIGVVGSRRASIYGQQVSRSLAKGLAYAGVTVVSGMARGIDTAAHQGCLDADGSTVAVLGSGLANIYPRENKKLFKHIVEKGCVISEFPVLTGPSAVNFPRRNRLISGLSAGIVVVEAAARSGALITARYALEQGREVFAVPGKVGHPQAVGTNRLIQQGAKLVSCIEDIVEEFRDRWIYPEQQDINENVSEDCDILKILSDEPMYIDHIIDRVQMSSAEVIKVLLQWECKGRVKRLAGNYFIKIM